MDSFCSVCTFGDHLCNLSVCVYFDCWDPNVHSVACEKLVQEKIIETRGPNAGLVSGASEA